MNTQNLCPEWAESANLRWAFWGWDPLPYYHRLGHKSVPFFGNSGWSDKWRSRLHSEETIKQMADLGINVAVTQFFKGFGLQYEEKLINELKGLVEIFHKYDIRVLGYTQFRSIFYETFLYEEPLAEGWAQRHYDGSLRRWAGSYMRWTPCINSSEFIAYMKKVVDVGAKDVGLDGFHFDNTYVEPCYCDKCRKLFREYLGEHIEGIERLGLDRYDFVEPPPEKAAPVHDPLYQEWIKFRVKSAASAISGIYEYIKDINKDLCFHSNPAFPRRNGWANSLSVNPYLYGKCHDLLCAENTNFPRYEKGAAVHQIRAYKFGESCGYKVLPASWLIKDGKHICPEKETQVKLSVIEPAVFGGSVGVNWALRTTVGDKLTIDNCVLAEALKKYISFLDNNKHLYKNVRTDSKVALLHSFESFAYRDADVLESYNAFENTLIHGNLQFDILMTEQIDKLGKYETLILANQFCLADQTIEKIIKFVEGGGRLVLTEESGRFDENHLERETNPFQKIIGLNNVHAISKELNYRSEFSEKQETKWISGTSSSLPQNYKKVLDIIKKALGDENIDFEADNPEHVIINQKITDDGRIILHIVNYRNEIKLDALNIKLNLKKFSGATCRIYDPENKDVLESAINCEDISLSNIATYKALEFIP